MKFSELIDRYIDLKIEGPPTPGWISIQRQYEMSLEYFKELEELKVQIDQIVESLK